MAKKGRPPVKEFEDKKVQTTIKIKYINWVSKFGCKDVNELIERLVEKAQGLAEENERLKQQFKGSTDSKNATTAAVNEETNSN